MQLDTDLTGLFGVTLAVVTLLARVPRVRALLSGSLPTPPRSERASA